MVNHHNPYQIGLEQNQANYTPLSPLSFIVRAAQVFGSAPALIYGDWQQDWRQTYQRARRLGSALQRQGIGVGDTVAAMLPNVPAMFECHFGVPMCGAVFNALNTRLDADTIAFMLRHSGAKVLLVDREYQPILSAALTQLGSAAPFVIEVDDPAAPPNPALGTISYEQFLQQGDPDFQWQLPANEWDAIALNYTSGTTGDPKGVVTHHRGAYLNAASNALAWHLPARPVYLWTLPMFHCNGWCFPWTLALVGGASVCLRRVLPELIFPLIAQHRVTHMCGAPIVYSLLLNAPASLQAQLTHPVSGFVAGAAPAVAIIEGCEKIGIELTHVYGLTETYGPAAACVKQPEWVHLPLAERARLNGRQGFAYPLQEALAVLDPVTLIPVPMDGMTMGEICFRGNLVMKGYLKNPTATAAAFEGGWFHSGDLAVCQPDGYIKIKDRSKDIIISGGENISSLEVEDALHRHPAVLVAAVVAMPDTKWGEVPCAFIELKPGTAVSSDAIVQHCKQHLAGFKVPKRIVFGELPKTSTGKIQKFLLREQARSSDAID